MTIDYDEKCFIYHRMISGEKMKKWEDTHGSDVHYQAISEISNTFTIKISEESFIIPSLDAHWTNEMITLDVNH